MSHKTEWIALSEPGVSGKALCFRYLDGDINLEMCNVDQGGNITRGRPVGIFDPKDICALASHSPEVRTLVRISRDILKTRLEGTPGCAIQAEWLRDALALFEVT